MERFEGTRVRGLPLAAELTASSSLLSKPGLWAGSSDSEAIPVAAGTPAGGAEDQRLWRRWESFMQSTQVISSLVVAYTLYNYILSKLFVSTHLRTTHS